MTHAIHPVSENYLDQFAVDAVWADAGHTCAWLSPIFISGSLSHLPAPVYKCLCAVLSPPSVPSSIKTHATQAADLVGG